MYLSTAEINVLIMVSFLVMIFGLVAVVIRRSDRKR